MYTPMPVPSALDPNTLRSYLSQELQSIAREVNLQTDRTLRMVHNIIARAFFLGVAANGPVIPIKSNNLLSMSRVGDGLYEINLAVTEYRMNNLLENTQWLVTLVQNPATDYFRYGFCYQTAPGTFRLAMYRLYEDASNRVRAEPYNATGELVIVSYSGSLYDEIANATQIP